MFDALSQLQIQGVQGSCPSHQCGTRRSGLRLHRRSCSPSDELLVFAANRLNADYSLLSAFFIIEKGHNLLLLAIPLRHQIVSENVSRTI